MPLIQNSRMPHIRHKTPIGGDHPLEFGAYATTMPIGRNHQNQLLCQRAHGLSNSKLPDGALNDALP